jgi:signal transduction histidine kinase
MLRPHNLRERVALFFAGFGALLSLLLVFLLYQTAHDLGQRLIDETLTAELDDYIARRERNPHSLPPSTVMLQGYVRDAASAGDVPPYLATLSPGRHDVTVGELSYRAAVLERSGARYYLLYDTSLQQKREERFLFLLAVVAVAVTLLAALGGIWLSRSVVAPVTELADKVHLRNPEDWDHPLADDFPEGEMGELARVFDRHVVRMRAFIERERALSADMSHELRTSLAVILSATEILLDDETLTEKQKARIARIDHAARDMAELGTALLLMAREEHLVSSGGGCVVAGVIEKAVDKHRLLLANKPVQVEVHTDPALEVPADCALIDILVSNLVRNAFSYTASGTVVIRQDARGLSITDTGKGIPGYAVDQVFLRHFRDMASEGAGIGLSLVKRICDRFGWELRLESRENSGTSVTILFNRGSSD